MSRHRAPEVVAVYRAGQPLLQAGITVHDTAVIRRALPPVPPVATVVNR